MMTLTADITPRYGPGADYALQPGRLPSGADVKVFFWQDGYCMVDDEGKVRTIRGWVPSDLIAW